MSRSITIRTRIALTVAGAGALALVTGLLVSSPSYGAPPSGGAAGLAAATVPTTTSGTLTDPTTVITRPTTSTRNTGTTSTSSSLCRTYTMVGATPGQVFQSWDFEYGSTSGWNASGATLAVTDAAAASGTHSLAITGLGLTTDVTTSTMNTLNVDWYSVTAKVRLAPGQSPQWLRLRADTGTGSTLLPGYVLATSNGWAQVTSWYHADGVPLADSCYSMTAGASATLHLSLAQVACSSAPSSTNLYLDDVKVTRAPASQTGTPTAGSVPAGCTSPTSPTTPTTSDTCTATYKAVAQWPGGFQADLAVTNLTGSTLSGWKLGWTFAGDEKVTALWGADGWTQSGRTVTVTGPAWSPLRPGGSATVGFVAGRGSSSPELPAPVTLNGQTCRTA